VRFGRSGGGASEIRSFAEVVLCEPLQMKYCSVGLAAAAFCRSSIASLSLA
jgi:hypothetical protein